MSTTVSRPIHSKPTAPALPPLENGEKLDQATFHERYKAMPSDIRAELIEGTVYMSSPVGKPHWRNHAFLIGWLMAYEAATPGVETMDNGTTILGDGSEPQPDAALRLVGGQSHDTDDGFIGGTPELVCEIAWSSESIDLHAKKRDYDRHGAREYLVVAVRTRQVFWFVRDGAGKFVELPADADGIIRSRVYPGLWLDTRALLAGNPAGVLAVVNQGIASAEHVEFVRSIKRGD